MNVTLFLTHQCNLRCDYCYNGESSDRVMSDEVLRLGVELAFSNPTADPAEPVLIRFFGGEPLLQLDLLKTAVAHARSLATSRPTGELAFSVTTNGTLLDQPTAAYLEQEGFLVAVSYDGCRASQDAHRPMANGSSSRPATLAGLRIALAELTSVVECCAVIAPDTVAGLARALDELLALGVPLVTFTPDWEAEWSEAQLAAFDLALDDFADRWLASYRSGHFMDVEPFDSKIRSHIAGGFPLRSRCPFGLGELAVAPSGRLYPCDRLVRQDDGGDLCVGQAATGVDHAKVAALRTCLAAPDSDCATCELQGRCMHWCGCVNVMTSGAVGTPSPTVCQLEQRIIGTADRVAATLYDEHNAAFLEKFYP